MKAIITSCDNYPLDLSLEPDGWEDPALSFCKNAHVTIWDPENAPRRKLACKVDDGLLVIYSADGDAVFTGTLDSLVSDLQALAKYRAVLQDVKDGLLEAD